ncbi:MAG TPA: hypothetical protein PLH63_08985, partial [Candidatus Cloacimonadota bacterium]|nr:hypothetical protein [Candidatus Cloacimonadota bacterium]
VNDSSSYPLTANHSELNFTGTSVMYVVSGNLSYEDMPLAGVTFTVNGNGVTTDENGNFFVLIGSGHIASFEITQANLDAAGYTEIVLAFATTTITTPTITADTNLGNILDASMLDPTTGNKTQTIALKTGWNLISINVVPADPTPSVVFNGITQIEEVRTESSVWESVGGTGTLTEIKPNQGYYVKVSADEVLEVSGQAAPIAEIGLRTNNWNLVGYTMQNMGQTRTMIQNDADILNISDLRETYYQADNPLGSSTLRFMKPGSGYWMRTGETVSPAFTYNPNYSNVIKSMEFHDVDNKSWVKGKVDNDFVGFPMEIVTIANGGATVIGETYKDLTTGDIFVATTATNTTTHNIRNIKGPKSIDVNFSHGQTLSSLTATIVEGTPFTPVVKKVFSATGYATLLNGLYDTQGNVINWGGFLTKLAAGNDLGATIDLSTTPIYIVYATDLTDDAAQQQAQVAVYCVTPTTSANTANELLAFGIQNSAGTTTVWGTVNETTHIAKVILPHDFNTTGAKIVFSIDGAGFYTDNTGLGSQLESGTTPYTHGVDNITTLTYYVSSSEGSPTYQDYNIQVVKLPVPVSPAPAPKRTP